MVSCPEELLPFSEADVGSSMGARHLSLTHEPPSFDSAPTLSSPPEDARGVSSLEPPSKLMSLHTPFSDIWYFKERAGMVLSETCRLGLCLTHKEVSLSIIALIELILKL